MDEGVVAGAQPAPLSRLSSRRMSDGRAGVLQDTNAEDGDYCRICRGDSSEEEPLFYPCKCSGSIKFVHQACLMEWLSHSQKKYCELCKTPFRFTKLYDPHMPGRLPTPIFIRQMFVHIAKGFLTWSRFLLVALVWLAWLPWSMRQVWRVLFYVVDCRWSAQYAAIQTPVYPVVVNTTDASPVLQNLTASLPRNHRNMTVQEGIVRALPQLLAPITGLLGATNSQFLLLRLVQTMFPSFFRWTQSISADYALDTSSDGQPRAIIFHRPTILGEVEYLKTLTMSPTINNSIIDVLEGQLVCLALVVVSILLFLIREWVINQQPVMAAAAAAAANLDNAAPVPNGQANHGANVPAIQDQAANDQPETADLQGSQDIAEVGQTAPDAENSPIPISTQVGAPEQPDENDKEHSDPLESPIGDASLPDVETPSSLRSSRSRPPLTGRNAMNDATSIRRSIEEQNDLSAAWPGLDIFKDLWSRADANPTNVLRIIDEEGRKEELGWIVTQMERLQREARSRNTDLKVSSQAPARGEPESETRSSLFGEVQTPPRGSARSKPLLESSPSPDYSGSNEVWADPNRKLWSFGEEAEEAEPVPDVAQATAASTPPSPRLSDQIPLPEVSDNAVVTQPDHPLLEEHPGRDMPTTSSDTTQPRDAEAEQQLSVLGAIQDWFWANELYQRRQEDPPGEDDEHIIQDPAQEAPFVPVQAQQPAVEPPPENAAPAAEVPRDPEVVAAAAQAGIDLNNADAAEDLEDLEGIMELIGLQGPLTGLIQNVVFSQFLISLTLLAGVGIPYVWGMLALHVLAHPVNVCVKLPVAVVTSVIDLAVDTTLFAVGLLLCLLFSILSALIRLLVIVLPPLSRMVDVSKGTSISYSLVSRSGVRLEKTLMSLLVGEGINLPELTVSARRSLHGTEELISKFMSELGSFASRCALTPPRTLGTGIWVSCKESMKRFGAFAIHFIGHTQSSLLRIRQFAGSPSTIAAMESPEHSGSDGANSAVSDLPTWTARDRTVAVALGYASIIFLGFLYLKVARFIFRLRKEEKVEGILADIVRQAGGVLKVILIIGIEMTVFPFYCGIMLDAALLPLFRTASLEGRIAFFQTSPLVALFVHWFIGTCYMFHFALFVSMCRKIMRDGVLYFIRDPDDPTFHPVRDVLERSVATQLSKIAFSALVYGGLVIICLGGVVWGLSSFDGIFPINWASGGPILEFPIDLIFYTFVLPILLRHIQPSTKINGVYGWWFRKLAGWLRLTQFLFGDRRKEEEGRHVRKTWLDYFKGIKGDVEQPRIGETQHSSTEYQQSDVVFVRDGKFVRTPGSDSVRIPKTQQVFIAVDESNERVDGQPDVDDGPHGKKNKDFHVVYIPPWFRLRIALFVMFVWIFTAFFGVCVTIIPLLCGRTLIQVLELSADEPNDLYAFTLGFSLGVGITYCITGIPLVLDFMRTFKTRVTNISWEALIKAWSTTKQVLGLICLGSYVAFILPMSLAILSECYVFVPLHTYLTSASTIEEALRSPYLLHVGMAPAYNIHVVQTWLLGILLLRIGLRISLTIPNDHTLLATALKSIIAAPTHSIFKPNLPLATRAFVLPSLILSTILFAAPLSLGWVMNHTAPFRDQPPDVHSKIYRYSFPGLMALVGCLWCSLLLRQAVERWRVLIRDEVYLVGERLHNFGERRNSRSAARKEAKGKGRAALVPDAEGGGLAGGGGVVAGDGADTGGARIAVL